MSCLCHVLSMAYGTKLSNVFCPYLGEYVRQRSHGNYHGYKLLWFQPILSQQEDCYMS